MRILQVVVEVERKSVGRACPICYSLSEIFVAVAINDPGRIRPGSAVLCNCITIRDANGLVSRYVKQTEV